MNNKLNSKGSLTEEEVQLIFYDTPGVVGRDHIRNWEHGRKVKLAWEAACLSDVLLFVVDAERQFKSPVRFDALFYDLIHYFMSILCK